MNVVCAFVHQTSATWRGIQKSFVSTVTFYAHTFQFAWGGILCKSYAHYMTFTHVCTILYIYMYIYILLAFKTHSSHTTVARTPGNDTTQYIVKKILQSQIK